MDFAFHTEQLLGTAVERVVVDDQGDLEPSAASAAAYSSADILLLYLSKINCEINSIRAINRILSSNEWRYNLDLEDKALRTAAVAEVEDDYQVQEPFADASGKDQVAATSAS